MSARATAAGGSSGGPPSSSDPPQDPSRSASGNEMKIEHPPKPYEGPETDPAIRLRNLRLIGEEYELPFDQLTRPGFVSVGKPIQVDVNAFKVLSWPSITVHQYDVSIHLACCVQNLQDAYLNTRF